MKRSSFTTLLAYAMLTTCYSTQANSETAAPDQELDARLTALEQKIGQQPAPSQSQPNAFNPNMSLILDGRFASYQNNPDDYHLPGFSMGEEAGLAPEGFAIGESELTLSANVDQNFMGQMTVSFANDGGETVTEMEEAFFETLAMGSGFTVRGGRFKSAVGYLNQQHAHAWDFADAPLVYSALWNGSYSDDGVRASWVAPTDIFLEIDLEAFSGEHFPSGGTASSGAGANVVSVNVGGDLDESQSWQAGISHYSADVEQRETATLTDRSSFTGNSDITGLNAVYKWAPNGNYKERFFKLQTEYFHRDETGMVSLLSSGNAASYDGTQSGYYIQGVLQFMPQWRTGLRYDALSSDNTGDDLVGMNVLSDADLAAKGIDPKRISAMLEWDGSEFSRIRLQFNHDESTENSDNQILVQYTMSLGTHGAHTF
jgi:hypothetical protein